MHSQESIARAYHQMWWSEAGHSTRRWAWLNIGAFMAPFDTGKVHGPERRHAAR